MEIKFVTGEEINDRASAKMSAFCFHAGAQHPLARMPRINEAFRYRGAYTKTPAVVGRSQEAGGKWSFYSLDVPEGTLLDFMALTKPSSGFRSMGHLLARVREGAALIRARVYLLGLPNSSTRYIDIEGNIDILTLSEAEVLGANIKSTYSSLYSEDARDDAFSITELIPAVKAAKITMKEVVIGGESVTILKAKRRARKFRKTTTNE